MSTRSTSQMTDQTTFSTQHQTKPMDTTVKQPMEPTVKPELTKQEPIKPTVSSTIKPAPSSSVQPTTQPSSSDSWRSKSALEPYWMNAFGDTGTTSFSKPSSSSSSSSSGFVKEERKFKQPTTQMPLTLPRYPQLNRNLEADVVIVGGGMTGLCCAYELVQKGLGVVVIEQSDYLCSGSEGQGDTPRTSAHLASVLDTRFQDLKKIHGVEGARGAWEAHAFAVDLIETIATKEGIECEFKRVPGYLYPHHPHEDGEKKHRDSQIMIRDEWKTCEELGISKTANLVSKIPGMTGVTPGVAIRFDNQAQFQPVKFCIGLARVLCPEEFKDDEGTDTLRVGAGKCRIFTSTGADTMKGTSTMSTSDKDKAEVKTRNGFVIRASHLVQATNVPHNMISMMDVVMPTRTYVIAARVPKMPEYALWWDTAEPYHYVRATPDVTNPEFDILIIGGEDHQVGRESTGTRFDNLEAWARRQWPQMKEIVSKWDGQIYNSTDRLQYIGKNRFDSGNVWMVTGDSGNGLTMGALGGSMLSELITGNKFPKWHSIFEPSRTRVSAIPEYLKHLAETQMQYTSYLKSGDVQDIEEIAPCSGAVIREGRLGKAIAVYKDENGEVHKRSAVCPHLKGMVCWNKTDKSWDCPVHGSRFDKFGKLMNGPANRGLDACK